MLFVQVEVIEGFWPDDRGIAILSFRSLRDAELWKDSVPEIRQHDWLDGVDVFIVPVASLPRQYILHATAILPYCYYLFFLLASCSVVRDRFLIFSPLNYHWNS